MTTGQYVGFIWLGLMGLVTIGGVIVQYYRRRK